ncbi:hypothetical protein GIX45_26750 [Erwinia sp. CPCC 100877]|nr:hypothetical protein [Erwinia sp. CPCC 100877]
MNTMLYFVLVIVGFILAFSGRVPANPHKNVILETTLPKDKLTDPQVLAVSRKYKKRLWQGSLLFALIALPIIILPYDSLVLIYFLIDLILFIGSFFYLEVIYIRKMTAVKVNNRWVVPTGPIVVDTKLVAAKNQRMLSVWWFLPSIIIAVVGFIYSLQTDSGQSTWLFGLISLGIIGLFLVFYYFIARQPVKPLTSDERINQSVNDIMRHHWSVLTIVSALVLSPLAFIPGLSPAIPYEQILGFAVGYGLVILVYIIFIFYYLFSSRRKQDLLIAQAAEYCYHDEDQYWKYSVYINPNDPRIMIPDRIGMNLSVNLGRSAGKWIMGSIGVITALILVTAIVPLLIGDFSANPFELTTSQTGVSLSAPLARTRKIDWQEIERIDLIDSLPKKQLRVYGTATQRYLTGEFQIEEQPAYLLVYKDHQPILKIKTKDKIYYYTNKDNKLTRQYFNKLQKKLKAD